MYRYPQNAPFHQQVIVFPFVHESISVLLVPLIEKLCPFPLSHYRASDLHKSIHTPMTTNSNPKTPKSVIFSFYSAIEINPFSKTIRPSSRIFSTISSKSLCSYVFFISSNETCVCLTSSFRIDPLTRRLDHWKVDWGADFIFVFLAVRTIAP